jgi:aspartyl-tRNA(Asn)/glutamyl-tRNA(Gln) amidotransferase subunit A
VVAAGVCDLAVGTDTGGSIRIPAAYCGIVGLKPSYGLIPLDGVFPLAPSCDHAGTLTATVGGAAALLAVLADPGAAGVAAAGGPAAPAGVSAPDAIVSPGETAAPDRFTLGVLGRQLSDPSVTAEVHDAVAGALAALRAAGWELREVSAPWLDDLPGWERVLAEIVAFEGYQVHRLRDTGGYAEGTLALLASGASVTQDQYLAALARRDELIAAVEASLAGLDALAGPTVGFVAPAEDPPFGVGADSGEGRFTGPYNLTGQPAIAIPVPAPGLPASLQLAGRRGGDAALLRVAAAAEALLSPRHPQPEVS